MRSYLNVFAVTEYQIDLETAAAIAIKMNTHVSMHAIRAIFLIEKSKSGNNEYHEVSTLAINNILDGYHKKIQQEKERRSLSEHLEKPIKTETLK